MNIQIITKHQHLGKNNKLHGLPSFSLQYFFYLKQHGQTNGVKSFLKNDFSPTSCPKNDYFSLYWFFKRKRSKSFFFIFRQHWILNVSLLNHWDMILIVQWPAISQRYFRYRNHLWYLLDKSRRCINIKYDLSMLLWLKLPHFVAWPVTN